MPLRDALAFVSNTLIGFNLKKDIKIIVSAKVFSAFHLVKNMTLGADICNSARGMMLALGCVHSLVCNTNKCPSGVATQDQKLGRGLVVKNKVQRVASYHKNTVHATAELIASAGLSHTNKLNRTDIYRRVSQQEMLRYDRIFPYIKTGSLLGDEKNIPDSFKLIMQESSPETFLPIKCLTRIQDECKNVSKFN